MSLLFAGFCLVLSTSLLEQSVSLVPFCTFHLRPALNLEYLYEGGYESAPAVMHVQKGHKHTRKGEDFIIRSFYAVLAWVIASFLWHCGSHNPDRQLGHR